MDFGLMVRRRVRTRGGLFIRVAETVLICGGNVRTKETEAKRSCLVKRPLSGTAAFNCDFLVITRT